MKLNFIKLQLFNSSNCSEEERKSLCRLQQRALFFPQAKPSINPKLAFASLPLPPASRFLNAKDMTL